MEITLNKADIKLAEYLAKKRYQTNRDHGIKDAKIGGQSNWETDLDGIGAEMAYCKLFNCYPDTNTEFGNYADADCYTVEHGAVDVKTTRRVNGHLLVKTSKKGAKVDTYVQMLGPFPTFRYLGFMPTNEIVRDDRLIDLGHGPVYGVHHSELHTEFKSKKETSSPTKLRKIRNG